MAWHGGTDPGIIDTRFGKGLSAQALAETRVDDAWVRATVPGQPATGAFMRITSTVDGKLV
ncbi:hypothetical protein RA263_29270, partial [Pseudomonas syringae pv. tagetis]